MNTDRNGWAHTQLRQCHSLRMGPHRDAGHVKLEHARMGDDAASRIGSADSVRCSYPSHSSVHSPCGRVSYLSRYSRADHSPPQPRPAVSVGRRLRRTQLGQHPRRDSKLATSTATAVILCRLTTGAAAMKDGGCVGRLEARIVTPISTTAATAATLHSSRQPRCHVTWMTTATGVGQPWELSAQGIWCEALC